MPEIISSELKKKYEFHKQKDHDWTPIGQLCRKVDLPHSIANKFIGKTEKETAETIKAFMKWYDDKIETHDIHSKEQWLGIIRHQYPINIGQQLLCVAALQLPKYELNHLGKAFPNLKAAVQEYKANGYK